MFEFGALRGGVGDEFGVLSEDLGLVELVGAREVPTGGLSSRRLSPPVLRRVDDAGDGRVETVAVGVRARELDVAGRLEPREFAFVVRVVEDVVAGALGAVVGEEDVDVLRN